jgi:hypothetical protein
MSLRLADKDDSLEDLYLTIDKLMEHHGMIARGIRQSVTRAPNLKPQQSTARSVRSSSPSIRSSPKARLSG